MNFIKIKEQKWNIMDIFSILSVIIGAIIFIAGFVNIFLLLFYVDYLSIFNNSFIITLMGFVLIWIGYCNVMANDRRNKKVEKKNNDF